MSMFKKTDGRTGIPKNFDRLAAASRGWARRPQLTRLLAATLVWFGMGFGNATLAWDGMQPPGDGNDTPPTSGDLVGDLPLPELQFRIIFKARRNGGDVVLKALSKVARSRGIHCFTIYINALNDPKMVKADDLFKPQIFGVNCESPYWFVSRRELTDKGQISSDGNVSVEVAELGRSDQSALDKIAKTLDILASEMQDNRDVEVLCRASKTRPDDECRISGQ